MMLEYVGEILVLVSIIISALFIAESKDLARAGFAFAMMSTLVALLFWMFNAVYAAIFQLGIYSGAVTIMIFLVMALTKEEKK
ncbi:MAG: hypothetical protein ACP6IQ_07595 [Candidatus Njordarchaeia archaeon]|nr:hypothetical protein [Candidatus Korarchaeota archaeon]